MNQTAYIATPHRESDRLLERNERAKRGWVALGPSHQKEILRYVSRLKSREAQARNLERALHVLAGGEARFMARDWNKKSDS